MGSALYLVLNSANPGFSTLVSGRTIALKIEALDTLANRVGVTPLSEFVSVSSEDLGDLMGDEVEVPASPERWFTAEEGLLAIRALASGIEADPGCMLNSSAVIRELREYETVLSNAQTIGPNGIWPTMHSGLRSPIRAQRSLAARARIWQGLARAERSEHVRP